MRMQMKKAGIVILAALITAALTQAPLAARAAPLAEAVPLGTFASPVYVTVAPGYRRLLFVVEQPGQIKVLRDEVALPSPFLDIRDLVKFSGEEGLLSMAFPPDYLATGHYYVVYNNKNGDVEIDEFFGWPGNNHVTDPATRRVVLVIPHPGADNHNGGQLQFGPDGYLYISVGDGGNPPPNLFVAGDPARDLGDLRGKILRIDPRPTGAGAYGIPAENPFVGTASRAEIYSYGLRNPWRFSFDGARIAIADVGQSSREEVNFLRVDAAAGANFGWPQYEGDVVFDNSRPGPTAPVFPMLTYDRSGGGCAVIGGYVSRDPNLAGLMGRYLYGDACTGEIRSFLPNVVTQKALNDMPVGIITPGVSGFGRGYGGTLYIAQTSGQVSRLRPPSPP